MGQSHSAPPEDARRFRQMVRATFYGDRADLERHYVCSLVGLQISRATYLDLCLEDQSQLEAITDSREREQREYALQDEKMAFFSAVERGTLVLGDTLLHIAVRLNHGAIVDFLLLVDHAPRPVTAISTDRPAALSSMHSMGCHASKTIPPRSGLMSTQTPNFRGDYPRDVAATTALRLILDTVTDVYDVLGVEFRDEAKVHRLVRSLARIWPLWMFDGTHEAASLVRVVYDTRSSDTAFGSLVKITLAVGERFRVVVTRAGLQIALKLLLKDAGGVLSEAQRILSHEWSPTHKRDLLMAILGDCFHTWPDDEQYRRRRRSPQEEQGDVQMSIDWFDAAMDAWLQMLLDLQIVPLKGTSGEAKRGQDCDDKVVVHTVNDIDVLALRRYEQQVWVRRMCPPPAMVDELCVHLDSLSGYLHLAHLAA